MTIFNSQSHSARMEKEKAELYMQIYKYAAEDFRSIPDQITYANTMQAWGNQVESRLLELGSQLNVHTHEITPHTHDLPYDLIHHIHNVPQAPSGTLPSEEAFSPISNETLQDVSYAQTEPAINATDLLWDLKPTPAFPANSTGVVSNLAGNFVTTTTSTLGDLLRPTVRRTLVIPVLLKPVLSPIAQSLIKAAI